MATKKRSSTQKRAAPQRNSGAARSQKTRRRPTKRNPTAKWLKLPPGAKSVRVRRLADGNLTVEARRS